MNDSHPVTISAVIPVYNSQDSLHELVTRLKAVLAACASQFEIILVNDGSADASWATVQKLAAEHPEVLGINLMRNFGQHNALLAGIRAASHELIVTLDDDLQNPPEEIPKLIAKINEGHDVVYGSPQQEQHGLWRDFCSVMIKRMLKHIMGIKTSRHISAFRIFRTHLRQAFDHFHSEYVSIDVLLSWATTKFAAVTVRHAPRAIGASNYTFKKLVRHTMNLYTGFSMLPLRVASLAGFGFTAFGFLVLVYVIGRYMVTGTSVPGFPFLASIIAILSGVQLFALGVIGEYIGRIFMRSLNKPCYAILETTASARAAAAVRE
jgi:undecaprenyl-phosphate 4-deoxy-4-formamido-L-arabinose transferase